MVWNRRHVSLINYKSFSTDKLAPYLLHVLMVVAVAAYVVLGAAAIRAIEAVEKSPNKDPTSEKYWHAIHQKSKNSSRTTNGVTERSLDGRVDERVDGRVDGRVDERVDGSLDERSLRIKRRASLTRSRSCVTAALKKIAGGSGCRKEGLSAELLGVLDACYEDDLRSLVRRSQEEKLPSTVPGPVVTVAPSMKNETITEYEYWTWTDAILFCFTVITTIGYGNVAPRTLEGQLFVILYGLFGVPFSMVVIANLGKFLAALLKIWTSPFRIVTKRFYRRLVYGRQKTPVLEKQNLVEEKNKKKVNFADETENDSENSLSEDSEDDPSVHRDAASLFVAFVLYIIVGSIIIASYEPEMDTFKAIYYIFVSLTTIGLGDVIPKSESYLAFTLIYIAVGLALTTIAIEIASDYLKKLHYFGRKMENVGNVQIWFGSKKLTMKQLVKNLGDQFNLPIEEMHDLNLDNFVDNAIKVEEGILPTLRNSQYPYGIKPIFVTDFKNPGNVIYADEDERYVVYNFTRETYDQLPPPPPNGGFPIFEKKLKK